MQVTPLMNRRQGVWHYFKHLLRHPFLPLFAQLRANAIRRLEWDNQTPSYFDFIVDAVHYTYAAGVHGDIAEFGTMTGRSAVTIASAMEYLNEFYKLLEGDKDWRGYKRLHLFDSFEGLPDATAPEDLAMEYVATGIWRPGSCRGMNEEQLAEQVANILPRDRFVIYKGWFSETAPTLRADVKLSMVNVDGDLYQSTIDCLAPLFERGMISPGCMLLFDDFDCNAARRELGERKAWQDLTSRFGIEFSDRGAYGLVSRAFIVHSYGVH